MIESRFELIQRFTRIAKILDKFDDCSGYWAQRLSRELDRIDALLER